MEKFSFRITPERFQVVHKDISVGSEPALRFYILVAASTGIASFGLISNSTAVVIGAMLVAPLMTPIFGIALALVRGNPKLMALSIRAEVAGVVLAVAMGYIIGLVHPALEATPEMLSRTQPNIFDLFVAVLAGFAGAYAMIDEHISPALPGVAIATAIVPPLANTGLCFALGAYAGGAGSFLLFFANFLSILLVASATFIASGMAGDFGLRKKTTVARRFGLAIVGFIVVAAFLSHALYKMVQSRELEKNIRTVLAEELYDFPTTGMDKMIHRMGDDKLYVLASVHSPSIISPVQVGRIQKALSDRVEKPTQLIIRSTMANDVSALGATSEVVDQNLDGLFLSKDVNPRAKKIKLTEQIIREYLASRLGLYLQNVNLLPWENKPIFLATVAGIRPLSSDEIQKLNKLVQWGIKDNSVEVIIRYMEMRLYDTRGRIRYEWSSMSDLSPEQKATIDQVVQALEEAFKQNEAFFLTNTNWTVLDNDQYHFLIEVEGRRLFDQNYLISLETGLSQQFNKPIHLHVWSKPEVLLNRQGYTSYDEATKKAFAVQEETFRKRINQLLELAD